MGGFDPDTGRRTVFIDGKPVKTKLENLRLIDDSIKPMTPLTDVRDRMGGVSLLEAVMQNRDDVGKRLNVRYHKLSRAAGKSRIGIIHPRIISTTSGS